MQGPGLTHRLRLPHHPTSSPSHLSAASRLPLGSEESDEPLPHHQTLLHQLRWQWAVGGACSSPTPVRRGGGHLAGRGVSEGPSETATSPGGQEGRGLKRWGGASGGRRRARPHPRPPSVLGLPGTGSFLSVCDLGHSLQPRPWGSGVLAGQGDTPVSTHAGPGGLGSVPGSPHSSSSVGHLPVLLPSTEAPPIVLNQRPPAFPHGWPACSHAPDRGVFAAPKGREPERPPAGLPDLLPRAGVRGGPRHRVQDAQGALGSAGRAHR